MDTTPSNRTRPLWAAPWRSWEITDELAGALFFVGDVKIVAAPGAVAWETTGRAPGKAEHDKSSADNLSHSRKSPDFEPNVYIQRYIGSNV